MGSSQKSYYEVFHDVHTVEGPRRIKDPSSYHLLMNARGHRRFDGSASQRFLKQDLDNKSDEGLKPKEFWHTRPELKEFPLKISEISSLMNATTPCDLTKSHWLNRNKTNGT
jgi:hypothetical protein